MIQPGLPPFSLQNVFVVEVRHSCSIERKRQLSQASYGHKGTPGNIAIASGIAYARGDDRQRLLNLRFGDVLTQTDMNATPKSDVSLFTSCFRVENLRILEHRSIPAGRQ